MTHRALVLVAGVDDRVELLQHPVGRALGADVVDVQQVDGGQPVEQVDVGALGAVGVPDLVEQPGQGVDRHRAARLASAALETSIASVVLPVPGGPMNHRPAAGVELVVDARSTKRRVARRRSAARCRSPAGGRRTRRGSAAGSRADRLRAWLCAIRCGPAAAVVGGVGRLRRRRSPTRRRRSYGHAFMRSCREPLPGVVHELRVLLLEGQHDVADRPVAVLGDDDVGLARALGCPCCSTRRGR